ncbi:MAG: shikimate dehydrogenase [Chloroflexi bacterium HGW-Chloroflexi-3]|nr:MAG: shikimate dehydrogenase [Chloroflexi bacterium HGW-Chloroflexi-3]
MKKRKIWRLGLIGYPLDHSYSPLLHQTALVDAGLTGTYTLYSLPDPQQIAPLLEKLRTGELDGLNVTIPYKKEVTRYLDGLTTSAHAIGAVNTIFWKGGMLIGDNTDAPGFGQDLEHSFRGYSHSGNHALVLGAGGAACSVVYALLIQGWAVTLAARRVSQAMLLSESFNYPNLHTTHWEAVSNPSFLKKFSLLVNTTPVGMAPLIDQNPLAADITLPAGMLVYDLIYNPQKTRLLQLAEKNNAKAINGLGMLLQQAVLSFEIWTGKKVSVEKMRQVLEKKLESEEER